MTERKLKAIALVFMDSLSTDEPPGETWICKPKLGSYNRCSKTNKLILKLYPFPCIKCKEYIFICIKCCKNSIYRGAMIRFTCQICYDEICVCTKCKDGYHHRCGICGKSVCDNHKNIYDCQNCKGKAIICKYCYRSDYLGDKCANCAIK